MNHRRYNVALAVIAASVLIASEPFVIDQRNDPREIPQTFQSLRQLASIGQEFRPSAHFLSGIDIYTADFDDDLSDGAQLSITIRRNTSDGPIQGKSRIVSLPDEYEGITRLEFPEPLPLERGVLYVFVVAIEGGDNWAVASGVDNYRSGRHIIRGTPHEDSDLWFRTYAADASTEESCTVATADRR